LFHFFSTSCIACHAPENQRLPRQLRIGSTHLALNQPDEIRVPVDLRMLKTDAAPRPDSFAALASWVLPHLPFLNRLARAPR
jgi:hypothetical protein